MQLDDVGVAVAELQGGDFPLSLRLHPKANRQNTGSVTEVQHERTHGKQ